MIFLLGIGATGAIAASGPGKTLANITRSPSELLTRNIIIPGRGGTAYYANLPLWTPKAALDHPVTVSLNQRPRFTPQARAAFPNIDRAYASKVRPQLCIAGEPNCGRPTPAPTPKPNLTATSRVTASLPYYGGAHYVATSVKPPIDASGAHLNGYGTAAGIYAMRTVGQNPATIYKSNGTAYGHGVYQYGTTTISVHPTLPMVRWNDPTFGSGVAYVDPKTNKWAYGSAKLATNFVFGPVPTPVPNPPTVMGLIALGVATIGLALAVAGIAIALTPEALAVGAFLGIVGAATFILGLITQMFDWSGCNPYCPTPTSLNYGDTTQGVFNPPPDGLGGSGYSISGGDYPDGGGGGGTDDNLLLC
jgi:hypothetical protein